MAHLAAILIERDTAALRDAILGDNAGLSRARSTAMCLLNGRRGAPKPEWRHAVSGPVRPSLKQVL
jgi:hypothetical protein